MPRIGAATNDAQPALAFQPIDPSQRSLAASDRLDSDRAFRSHVDAGFDASAADVISVKVQRSASEGQSIDEVRKPELIRLGVLVLGETAGAGIGKGEECQHEQEPEGAPLHEVRRVFFRTFRILELQGHTHAEFGLVHRRQHLLLDDPEGHRDARLEKPECFGLGDHIHSGRWL